MMPPGSDNGPAIRWRLLLDAKELAEHPELHAWCAGPLAEAMQAAPFPVSLWIVSLDDPD